MFTRDERRALLYLAVIAAAGGVVRAVRAPGEAPGAPVAPELEGEDLGRQVAAVRRATLLARPLRPGERVDVDRASAEELERLPRIGPELARRIVADRDAHGWFGSLQALDRVSGIGPTLLRDLERRVAFSGAPRPPRSDQAQATGSEAFAPSAPVLIRTTAGSRTGAGCAAAGPVSVNRATARELECLPGIGPALAQRLVADRARRGPFREVKDLERVPGIGPALRARLAPHVAVP